MCVFKKYLVQRRHLGSSIQQQFNYLDVPHFSGFDKRSLSLLKKKDIHFHQYHSEIYFDTTTSTQQFFRKKESQEQ